MKGTAVGAAIVVAVIVILLVVIVVVLVYAPQVQKVLTQCLTSEPSTPIIVTRDGGEALTFSGEDIKIKYQSDAISLLTIATGPSLQSKMHVDENYDQFYFITQGSYTFSYIECQGSSPKVVSLNVGDMVYINKGTPFQFTQATSQTSSAFGGFLPGNRVQLVRDLAAYQQQVGQGNLDPAKISEIEARYCVF